MVPFLWPVDLWGGSKGLQMSQVDSFCKARTRRLSVSVIPINLRDCDNANNQNGCPSGTCLALHCRVAMQTISHASRPCLPFQRVTSPSFPKPMQMWLWPCPADAACKSRPPSSLMIYKRQSCCAVRLVCLIFGASALGNISPFHHRRLGPFHRTSQPTVGQRNQI